MANVRLQVTPWSPWLGGPQTQLGRPWPSYWAALDGVRSLILPGNDDGGALRAAVGPPSPSLAPCRSPESAHPPKVPPSHPARWGYGAEM